MTDDQIQEPAPQPDVATELDRIGRIPGVRDRAGVGDGSVHDAVVALDGARVPQPDVAKVPLTVSEKHSLWMASGWESRGAFIRGVEAAERSHSDAAAPPPEPKGYLRNCEITQRRGPSEPDWIFYQDAAGNTYCQLDGYRITPLDAPQPDVAKVMELADEAAEARSAFDKMHMRGGPTVLQYQLGAVDAAELSLSSARTALELAVRALAGAKPGPTVSRADPRHIQAMTPASALAAPQPDVAAIISGLREQIEGQRQAILRAWDYGKHLEGEAALWEERARHAGWTA